MQKYRKFNIPSTETKMFAPENGWQKNTIFVSFWGKRPMFRCELLVLGSVPPENCAGPQKEAGSSSSPISLQGASC